MMIRLIASVFITIGILLLTSFDFEECKDCYQEYLKMASYYKNVKFNEVHMIYTTYSIKDGLHSERLTTEIIQNNDKIKLSNGYVTTYQDGKTYVVIAYDRKQIVIQNAGGKDAVKTSWDKMSAWYHIDTLKKY